MKNEENITTYSNELKLNQFLNYNTDNNTETKRSTNRRVKANATS